MIDRHDRRSQPRHRVMEQKMIGRVAQGEAYTVAGDDATRASCPA